MTGITVLSGSLLSNSGGIIDAYSSSSNDSLTLIVTTLGIIIGFILSIASYLLANQSPDIKYSDYSSKSDTSLIINKIKSSIDQKKNLIKRLPFIYGGIFVGLMLILLTLNQFVIGIYIVFLLIIFIYISLKIHNIITTNIEISEAINNKARKEFDKNLKK